MYLSRSGTAHLKTLLARSGAMRRIGMGLLGVGRLVEMPRARVFFARSRVPREARRPDVICIGAQRAETTWLDRVLWTHPSIAMPHRRKDVHFHDLDLWKVAEGSRSHWHFGRDKVRGEITPRGSILPQSSIQRMHAISPDVRLIVLLRDRIERAWSTAFGDPCKTSGQALAEVQPERLLAKTRSTGPGERGRSSETLTRLRAVIPEDRLAVQFCDDRAADPGDVRQQVGAVLELDATRLPDRSIPATREDAGGAPMPDRLGDTRRSQDRDEIEALRPETGDRRAAARIAAAGAGSETG